MFTTNQVIGHRGAAAYAPENTMASFNKAYELGCRFIEFDVMLNVEGIPFVFHDESLKRTTKYKGEFGMASTELLQSLDAGRWFSKAFKGEKIPSFSDVLLWLSAHEMQANIEIKPYPGFTQETTMAVLSYINRYWPEEKNLPLLSSFDSEAIKLCATVAPEIPRAFLMERWNKDWIKLAREFQCTSIHLNKKLVTQARILEMKQQGYEIAVYTVNRKRSAKKFFGLGVDAVFSDYPDLMS